MLDGKKEIKYIDLFSGIGGFRLGLGRANEDYAVAYKGEHQEEDSASGRGLVSGSNEEQTGHSNPETAQEKRDSRSWSNCSVSDGEPRTLWRSQSAFSCVWSCDNNKYANQVYTKRFGKENHFEGDIRTVDAQSIPDFDLLCAGFPCQSFSLAGKRKGFQDTRGTLFFEIARIAEAKRPPLLLLENVKGLLSNDRGETFATILQVLGNIGYWVEWQVLNSKHFGVPQNRERVFIVGHLGEGSGREVFPVGEADPIPAEASGLSSALRPSVFGWSKPKILENVRIRRLTPVECERLQGFPDGWTEGISDTQRYKVLGNAVTVGVIAFLGFLLKNRLLLYYY